MLKIKDEGVKNKFQKLEALTTNYYPVDGVEYESFNESEDEEEDDE